MAKLVAAVRAVTVYVRPVFALQVTPRCAPREESSITKIWLLAVTAVVFTVSVVAPVLIATEPAGDEPQTAGVATEVQVLVEVSVPTETAPGNVVVIPVLPMVIAFAVVVPMLRTPAADVSRPKAAGTVKRPRILVVA